MKKLIVVDQASANCGLAIVTLHPDNRRDPDICGAMCGSRCSSCTGWTIDSASIAAELSYIMDEEAKNLLLVIFPKKHFSVVEATEYSVQISKTVGGPIHSTETDDLYMYEFTAGRFDEDGDSW